jgi:hypothetical protein
MEWNITLSFIVIGIAATALSAWQSGRPRKDSHNARWIPWRFFVLVSGAVLLLAVVHAVNLIGIETGGGVGSLAHP